MLRTAIKRALIDVWHNRFLNLVTMLTICLSDLITSAFFLFFKNADTLFKDWEKSVRIMAYLKTGISDSRRAAINDRLQRMEGVARITYISKESAFEQLKGELRRQASILDDRTVSCSDCRFCPQPTG